MTFSDHTHKSVDISIDEIVLCLLSSALRLNGNDISKRKLSWNYCQKKKLIVKLFMRDLASDKRC